jgi:exopolysaccharide biosynthesis WecB/TagA/CpsF family protein
MNPEYEAWPRVSLAGVAVDLMESEDAVALISGRACEGSPTGRPLSVVSANLDHIAQFGSGGRWYDTLDYRLGTADVGRDTADRGAGTSAAHSSDWLTLLDGAPLVAEAERLTDRSWPRLAGSDLIGSLLDRAELDGTSVGFLGGSYIIQRLLSRQLTRTRPGLIVSGMWSPDRGLLADREASLDLATTIAASGTQLLVVGLGKPRQELWMAKYGPATGANVLLAFGAVVDFLAGGVRRAPQWAAENGLEWAWRLAMEPKRLARRYLIDDPPGLIQMRQDSHLLDPAGEDLKAADHPKVEQLHGTPDGTFVGIDESADVAVHIVTHNSAESVEVLLRSLRPEARLIRLKVIIADNASTDGTLGTVKAHPDVIVVPTGGDLGIAGGINAARRFVKSDEDVLILAPDVVLRPGAIQTLYFRRRRSGAGIVVPRLLTGDRSVYPSIRHEPALTTAIGDAILGSRAAGRPRWLSEIDFNPESYQHPHRIAWASGVALLIGAELADQIGEWDEQFFLYSEETDYFRRARELGAPIWYEPSAVVTLTNGVPNLPPELNALMTVNRIRYIRKYRAGRYARWFAGAVILAETLRAWKPERRGVLATLLDEGEWERLPGGARTAISADQLHAFPSAAVIIPAHNEAATISRTLQKLTPVLATGQVEVIVACNGCNDETAEVAAQFDGVRVLNLSEPSKIRALNEADAATELWPRVYLDADIDLDPIALRILIDQLTSERSLAARPTFRYDDSDASWPVRAFYRARRRIPSTREALWGAGVYGLTEKGHDRFGSFPDVVADDLFVDLQFGPEEKAILPTPPVNVRTPRTTASLLQILRRNYRGQAQLASHSKQTAQSVADQQHTTTDTMRELIASIHGPTSAADALVYAIFVITARQRRSGTAITVWERDDSSRLPIRRQA